MFIDRNLRRFDPFRPFKLPNGKQHGPLNTPELRAQFGVTEIPDPTPPEDFSDDTYYVTHQDEAPYVIWTRKSDEQIAQAAQSKLNQASEAYLRDTDWMVTRFAETGVPIPDEVKAKRQAARDAIVRQERPL